MSDAPLLRATGLWMETSAKTGKPYFTGRLGGLRVLILENNRRESDDQPSHFLMLGEAQQQGQQPRQETALDARHRMAREAEKMRSDIDEGRGPQRRQPQQQADPELDDEIPF